MTLNPWLTLAAFTKQGAKTDMASKKAFALRVSPQVMDAMQRWADDDLRSLNAQIEYVLRDALVKSGRVKLVQRAVTDIVDATEEED